MGRGKAPGRAARSLRAGTGGRGLGGGLKVSWGCTGGRHGAEWGLGMAAWGLETPAGR